MSRVRSNTGLLFAVLIGLVVSYFAPSPFADVKTKTAVKTDITNKLPTNNTRAISAAKIREVFNDIVDTTIRDEAVHDLGTLTGTTSIDLDAGEFDRKSFTANADVVISGITATRAKKYTIFVKQGVAGGARVQWPAGIQGVLPLVDMAANAVTPVVVEFDGTTLRWPEKVRRTIKVGSVADLATLTFDNLDGYTVETSQYTAGVNGGGAKYGYSKTSTAPVDNVFVHAGPSGLGRFVAVKRDLADLEFAGLSSGDNITTLLATLASNFESGVYRIRLPRSLSNLVCGRVSFPEALERFDVLAGNCTITQLASSADPIMWLIPSPKNVDIGEVTFLGNVNAANFTTPTAALIRISDSAADAPAGVKSGVHGRVRLRCNVIGSTGLGVAVVGDTTTATAYEEFDVAGAYEDSGLSLNRSVRRLKASVTVTDPDGYAYNASPNRTNARGFGYGRVVDTIDVDVNQHYGYGPLFGFAFNGAAGQVRGTFHRVGYRKDGTALTGEPILHTLSKVDSITNSDAVDHKSAVSFDFTVLDCHPDHKAFLAESTPGNTNNTTWRIVDANRNAALQLSEINDEGRKENYGNAIYDSVLGSITTGLSSSIGRCDVDSITCKANTGATPDVPAVNARVFGTTVTESVSVNYGTQTEFVDCRLPNDWGFAESTAANGATVLSFSGCTFGEPTALEPATPANLKVGLRGPVENLDLSALPVGSLPYLRIDAVDNPDAPTATKPSSHWETINRPVGWLSTGPATPLRYSSSAPSTLTQVCRILNVDRVSNVGGLVFPGVNTAADYFGSWHWDLGTDSATIEAAITFQTGGDRKAGIFGRGAGGNAMMMAMLNEAAGTVEIDSYNGNTITMDESAAVPGGVVVGTEYVLKLEVVADNQFRVYVDGVLLIDRTYGADIKVGNTEWGIKHRDNASDGGDAAVGPTYRYIEVRPNALSDAAERYATAPAKLQEVDTVASLKNLRGLADGQVVTVNGYNSAGDAGEPWKVTYDAASTLTVDGGFVHNGPGGVGRFVANDQTVIHGMRWGLVSDFNGTTGTDNSSTLQAMIDAAESAYSSGGGSQPPIKVGNGSFAFNSPLYVDRPVRFVGNGMDATKLAYLGAAGYGLTFGPASNHSYAAGFSISFPNASGICWAASVKSTAEDIWASRGLGIGFHNAGSQQLSLRNCWVTTNGLAHMTLSPDNSQPRYGFVGTSMGWVATSNTPANTGLGGTTLTLAHRAAATVTVNGNTPQDLVDALNSVQSTTGIQWAIDHSNRLHATVDPVDLSTEQLDFIHDLVLTDGTGAWTAAGWSAGNHGEFNDSVNITNASTMDFCHAEGCLEHGFYNHGREIGSTNPASHWYLNNCVFQGNSQSVSTLTTTPAQIRLVECSGMCLTSCYAESTTCLLAEKVKSSNWTGGRIGAMELKSCNGFTFQGTRITFGTIDNDCRNTSFFGSIIDGSGAQTGFVDLAPDTTYSGCTGLRGDNARRFIADNTGTGKVLSHNGSFEHWNAATNRPLGWTLVNPGTVSRVTGSTATHGNYAANVTCTGTAGGVSSTALRQEYDAKEVTLLLRNSAAARITVSFDYRAATNDTQQPAVVFDFGSFRALAQVSSLATNKTKSGQWSRLSFSYLPPNSATGFAIEIIPDSTGTAGQRAYVDGVVVSLGSVTSSGFTSGEGESKEQFVGGKYITYGAGPPVAGDKPEWPVGSIVHNSSPAVGQPTKWICTTAGDPGTWTAGPDL